MTKDLDPQIASLLEKIASAGLPKIQDIPVSEARAQFDGNLKRLRELVPPIDIADVHTTTTGSEFGEVPVRIYDPAPGQVQGGVVYFHGGGHVVGGLDSHDSVARSLAARGGCKVVSVDYRLAPDHVFPAAVEDCFDALRWVQDQAEALNIAPDALVVAGDSAGGNLAVVAALLARDAGGPQVAAQVLIYPVVDYRGGTPSYDRYGAGYGLLETETVAWFRDHYLPEAAMQEDWRAAPSLADVKGLPPTQIILAECDVLVDEGHAFAEQLTEAGVAVEKHVYPGMIHGFFNYVGFIERATEAHDHVGAFLKDALKV